MWPLKGSRKHSFPPVSWPSQSTWARPWQPYRLLGDYARLDLMGLGSWPNPGPQNGLLPNHSIPLIPGLAQFSSFPQSHPFSHVRMSGNSFQETTSCTLINSPPRKIHFPLQSWHNPMRILYWRIKSTNGSTRWPERFCTKSREEVTTPPKQHLTVWGHFRHPKT